MTSMSGPSSFSTPISPVTDPAPRPQGGERGVVYVATKDARFVEEAALSAITMKQMAPGLPVWLYTDQADCPLNRLNVFDHVEIIETCTDYEDVSAGAKIDRLRVLTNAPFERCLQIDTDTRIKSDAIQRIFGFLDHVDIAMVECHPDSSISRGIYGQPMFNGGLVLFKRGAKTQQLFEAWRDLSDKHFRIADTPDLAAAATECPYIAHVSALDERRTLLRRDQLALAQLFSPVNNRFDVTYAQLSEGWNFRGMGEHRRFMEPVIIDHRNAYKFTTLQDLLAEAFRRFATGDRPSAGLIYNHAATHHAPEIANIPAAELANAFAGVEDPIATAIAADAKAALAAADATPQWLDNALRIAALHLRAGQTQMAAKIGEAIKGKAASG